MGCTFLLSFLTDVWLWKVAVGLRGVIAVSFSIYAEKSMSSVGTLRMTGFNFFVVTWF